MFYFDIIFLNFTSIALLNDKAIDNGLTPIKKYLNSAKQTTKI